MNKWRPPSIVTVLILGSWLLGGCAGRVITPYAPGEPPIITTVATHENFSYQRSPLIVEAVTEPTLAGSDYTHQQLRFPARLDGDAEFSLNVNYYRGTASGPRHLVIIVPVWGDSLHLFPSTTFRHYLQRRSDGRFDILEIDGGGDDLIDWQAMRSAPTPEIFWERSNAMAARIEQSVIAIRQMVDWAQAQPDIDENTITITGFSMGAVISAIALGAEERFAAGAVVMGAGELAEIFAYCKGRVGSIREAITERFGWSNDEYRHFFAEVFKHGDPSNFRDRYDPQSIVYFDAMYDDCMPAKARNALWRQMGKPRRITFLSRHRGAFLAFTPLSFNYAHRVIYDFITDRVYKPEHQSAVAAMQD